MNIAIMKNNTVVNTAIFDDLQTAVNFLNFGEFNGVQANAVEELPDGFGIGDYIDDNGKWTKKISVAEKDVSLGKSAEEELNELKIEYFFRFMIPESVKDDIGITQPFQIQALSFGYNENEFETERQRLANRIKALIDEISNSGR